MKKLLIPLVLTDLAKEINIEWATYQKEINHKVGDEEAHKFWEWTTKARLCSERMRELKAEGKKKDEDITGTVLGD